MFKILTFDKSGKKKAEISLPKEFASEGSLSLLAQAIHVYQDRRHPGTKDTKTRAEVNITKKKIYKQKGTGGARHGAASAPIFVGGGAAHGPKPIKRILSLPFNMRKKALSVAMNRKIEEKLVVGVEGLSDFDKTKSAALVLSQIRKELKLKSDAKLLVVLQNNKAVSRIFRNIQAVVTMPLKNMNAYDVFTSRAVVLDAAFAVKKTTKK